MDLFGEPVSSISNDFLRRAALLALRAEGLTSPNPIVGCVIVRDGEIVGEGYHGRAGRPHAEVEALTRAGERTRGATAYVTLEPCAHTGKTPPCVDALIAAGVSRVVIGMRDPNPVAGGGAETLTAAGVEVEFATDPVPFERLVRPWLKRIATGLPYVTVKLGLSIDGHSCTDTNSRIAVTGQAGREVTLSLRARRAAVMVGRHTAQVDDPTLLRADVCPYPATRVILCSTEAPSPTLKLMAGGAAPTIVLMPDDLIDSVTDEPAPHVSFVSYRRDEGLEGALEALAATGVDSVLVEAGPTLLAEFLHEAMVDELITVVAGGFIGSAGACSVLTPMLADDALIPRFNAVYSTVHDGVAITRWLPVDSPEGGR